MHEAHGGHQAIYIEILEESMRDLQHVYEMPNYQISISGHLWEKKLCGATPTLDFIHRARIQQIKIKHSYDILGAKMLWKPKEARILTNFIDQPM